MKKIVANLALTGSLLMAAAVLAPLIHGLDQGQSIGLWVDQDGRGNLSTVQVVARADLSTGLAPQNIGVMAQLCGQGGQFTDSMCQAFSTYWPIE